MEGSLSMIHIRLGENELYKNDKMMLRYSKTGISHLNCPFSHLQGALLGLISPNKTRRVHKYTALNASNLREFLVSDPAPRLRQRLSTIKAFLRDRDGLYAPITTGLVRIDNIERLHMRRHGQLELELKQVLLFYCKSSANDD